MAEPSDYAMVQRPKFVELAQFFTLPRDTRLRNFGGYWLQLRGEDGIPRRSDLDPAAFPQALPIILLSRLVEGMPIYELAGEAVNAFYGRRSIVGLGPADLVNPSSVEDIRASLAIVRREKAARYSRNFYLREDGEPVWAERLLFPLAEDGETVDHTITLVAADLAPAEDNAGDEDLCRLVPHYWKTI